MSNDEDDGDGFSRRGPAPGGDSEWSPRGVFDAGQSSGGAPGKRSRTEGIAAANPRAMLLAKLRTVRGQISGVRDRHLPGMRAAVESRDMNDAQGAASDLGIALGTIDREVHEVRQLATALDSDGARVMVENLARKVTDLHTEAEPVLALAPPTAQRMPALAAFAVHWFLDKWNANDATEDEQRRQWLARLNAHKSGSKGGRGALIDASRRFAGKSARKAATIDKPAEYEETRATIDESHRVAKGGVERSGAPQPERAKQGRVAATIDKPAEYEETRATIDDSRRSADHPPASHAVAGPDRAAATIDKPAEYEETRATVDDSPRTPDRAPAKRAIAQPDRARQDRAAATIDKPAEYEDTRATIDHSRVTVRAEAKHEARRPDRARPDRAAATIDKPAEYEETRATINDSPEVKRPRATGRPDRAAAMIDKPAEYEETRATIDDRDDEDDESTSAQVRRHRGPVTIDKPAEWEETRATIDMAVQRHAQPAIAGTARDRGDIQRLATYGVSADGGALPHGDTIQRSFGHHDVSGVRAHVGGRAAAAAGEIGADAYATGNQVAFASEPSLFIAAHEAAHTIQQQRGVSLLGGVGQVGDAYEQHADAVADRVVRGESAEGLLDSMAGPTGSPGTGVQLKAARGATSPHERIGRAIDDGRRAVRQVREEFIPAANVAYSAREFDAAGDAASSTRVTLARAENEAKAARRLLVDVVEDAYRSKLELEVNELDASLAVIKPEVDEVVRKAPPDRASLAPQPGFGTGPECGEETHEAWQGEASRQAHTWKRQLDAEDAELLAGATPPPIPNDACALDGPRAADAFSGIALYLQVKDALKAKKATQAYDEKHVGPGNAGPYELHANTRNGEIVYYLARHAERGQVEWAIGPDSVDAFVANVDIYVGAARASLPGSKNVENSQKDGAARAEHIPSILELEAFGQAPYQQQQPDPTFELGRDSTMAAPNLLGVDGTNGGSAMVGTRNTHLRLSEYTQEAARLARQLKAEVDAGKLDHMQARKEAVGGRNHLMQNVREKMSPAARYSSQKIKTDKGVSVDFMTKKKTADILQASIDGGQGMEVFGEKGDAGKLRVMLAEESGLWERYRGALEAGEGAQRVYAEALQELGEQPAVSRAVVNSAGKSNGMVTALAKGGRGLGTAAAIYGVYDMVATIVDAEEGKRLHVAGGEMSSFAGGIVGGEAGAMAAVWLASLVVPGVGTGAVIVVSLIGGMVGGAVGANMGPGINEIAGGVAHDGMEAVVGPGMPQNGGYGGLLDRSTKSGAKAFDIETRLADTLLAMDFSLVELEQKIEAARNEQEMQAYQKARLDLLDGRHEMGTIYAALKSGAIDQGQVWDMMGERPDERGR